MILRLGEVCLSIVEGCFEVTQSITFGDMRPRVSISSSARDLEASLGAQVRFLSARMSYKTELCRHGFGSTSCARHGCGYAHTLAELRVAPLRERHRYARGLCCRFIGQEMAVSAHHAILRYFDDERRRGVDPPAWAHCYVWAHREWAMDYRRDLGDFGVIQDYEDWKRQETAQSLRHHRVPGWLLQLLEWRRRFMLMHRESDYGSETTTDDSYEQCAPSDEAEDAVTGQLEDSMTRMAVSREHLAIAPSVGDETEHNEEPDVPIYDTEEANEAMNGAQTTSPADVYVTASEEQATAAYPDSRPPKRNKVRMSLEV